MLGFLFRLLFAGMAFYAILALEQENAANDIGTAAAMLIGMACGAYAFVRA